MAHPSLILYEKGGFSPAMWVYRNVSWMYLPYIQDIYIYTYILWNRHWHRTQKNMNLDATCRSSTRSLQKAQRIYQGPKLGATNLEAGLPILVLWPHFGVQNLALVLGPQNTNRSYSTGSKCATAAASWQQHVSVILRGYMPEKLALPLIWISGFGALGPPRLW